ncbi:hypothetical protein EHI8A_106900 [Entamoeba histolytica HM-1:IMSS-B]|uniref:Ras guanine nucleotide exchange factor glfB-like C-terminal domain-containing protein n=6 Tax=Entamoeba histolytica TaxID=5759 RepID=C4LZ31_ENTH1|nr:hypothetical protein EHI_009560 [Entamoeba histolytica HM-1:IMSS]EMD43258.1 Hypothetical protein EHI5A_092810 [Entamoeba histolytica KU27]EMH76518.1 hypothetical protein EHI8A_106900 [Entamoeba histolytica HM-1:IMSS-B]EMS14678.1 hypothetical protein KM1_119130 [Entamoeba histolytica HM-3:IMSS]ENY61482.1 hypothetical protein EHI7A_099500 [Entamoeba histolytica HM-1:IMSS-A]BAN39221.1 hypothetical protein [Entamoeba histolytica]|eukprot:XP_654668.1 hypothetical protein EHI_009560 [Entamoeba histolytica HM-1:IMSS]
MTEFKTTFNLFSKVKQTCGKGDKRIAKPRTRVETSSETSEQITTNKSASAMANLLKTLPDWSVATRKIIDTTNIETFPIAGDLPRLLKHLTVYEIHNGDFYSVFPTQGIVTEHIVDYSVSSDGAAINAGDCLKILQTVCMIFESDELAQHLGNEWNAIMDNSCDLSVQKTFLMRILKKVFIEEKTDGESPIIMFLKAINQKIIGPATMRVRCQCGSLIIKDAQPMVWEVAVIIMEDKTIISHYRRQETSSKKPEEYFRFLWELRMVFNRDLTQLESLVMGVTEIEFDDITLDSVRDKVSSALEPMKSQDCFIGNMDD